MRQPKQKLSQSAKDEKWVRENIDFYISEASFNDKLRRSLSTLYRAYNGVLDDTEYSYVTDRYNSRKNQGNSTAKLNYPAKIRNMNILKPVVDLLMGEKSKRYMNFQVLARNADVVSRREDSVNQAVNQSLTQLFINAANAVGVPTGVDSQETPPPAEVASASRMSYKDKRAIMGQEAIDYFKDYNEVPEYHQKCFFDWLVAGEAVTYKTVINDDLYYEDVPPWEFDCDRSPNVDFGEDGSWQIRRVEMTVSQVVDRFYDLLQEKPEILTALDEGVVNHSGAFTARFSIDANARTSTQSTGRMVEVYHVVWKTLVKRGELSYFDEVGQPQKMWVDEDYKLLPGEKITWHWLNKGVEAYKLDGKHIIGFQDLPVQRNEMSNKSKCKLPYNSRRYSDRNADNISVVMLGLHYQILYNIYHYRFELTMAKSKDKIILMEINAIPKRHGWDEDKFMYYADAQGFMFVDTMKDGKSSLAGFNQFQVLDASLGQYAAATMDVLRSIKAEWEELVGFNAQRKGQSAASEGLGARQQSIFQSSVITEELFRRFEKFQERDYQGLLDMSKYAWRKGKKSSYVTSDMRNAVLDIEPGDYQEADYGVRAINSGDENEKLNILKQAAQAFAQNGSAPSTIAEILSSTNFAKTKQLMRDAEAEQQRIQAEQQQAEQAGQQQLQQMQQDAQLQMQEFEAGENELDRQNKYEIAALTAHIALLTAPESETPVDDSAIKAEELSLKRQELLADMEHTRRELSDRVAERSHAARENEKDRTVEREKIAASKQIARMKPKPKAK